MLKYVLLMRHGKHEAADSSNQLPRKLSEEGEKDTRAVAERLNEVLEEFKQEPDLSISIGAFWHARTDEVLATVNLVSQVLGNHLSCTPEINPALDPASFKPYQNINKHVELANSLKDKRSSESDSNAVMIIGHQPFLGWLAYELTGKALPITQSELLCLALEDRFLTKSKKGYLRWVLSTDDQPTIWDLKAKIKSKMDTAKLLGGFITAVLGFLLASLVDENRMGYLGKHQWAFYIAAALFFVGVGLFLATMYAYDRLLMPKRFWGETPPPADIAKRPKWLVWRPPSSAGWVLYQNMMRIWFWLFTPATWAVVIGLLFLGFAVFKPTGSYIFLFFGTVGFGLGAFWLYYRQFGPRVGSED